MKISKKIDYAAYWLTAKLLLVLVFVLAMAALSMLIKAFYGLAAGDVAIFIALIGAAFISAFFAKGFAQIVKRLPRWYEDVDYEYDNDGWVIRTKVKASHGKK